MTCLPIGLLLGAWLLSGTPTDHLSSWHEASQATAISVIPKPAAVQPGQGTFAITANTTILTDPGNAELKKIAGLLANKLRTAAGLDLTIRDNKGRKAVAKAIVLTLQNAKAEWGKEGYELAVTPDGVIIRASQPAGIFYGVQTLRQLLPAAIESPSMVQDVSWIIPAVHVQDQPRFSWRGLHLDVGRHFMPVAFIKTYLDHMALHKLNTFHWHLTEDQGWRIEIKKYPKLTQIASRRAETLIGHSGDLPKKYDHLPYGGYYTQEEVREIVQYAKDRYITVVPEIEMPGHAKASIAAYPELGVTGKPVEAATEWGIFPDIYNVDDKTFSFLEDVLTEVMTLFPGEYIHIGGDEATKKHWRESPRIQQKIRALGLKDEHELQSYFIQRMEKFINAKGRKLIGWDEILEGGLAPNATVMSWRGEKGGIAAAKAKHYAIMSPASHLYFDHYQGTPRVEPLAIGGFSPLKHVYSYEPIPSELTSEEARYILGAQANVWTEYMRMPQHVEYMVFPRVAALAELVWSPKEARNWEDFKSRLTDLLQRYAHLGINYARSIYNVTPTPKLEEATGEYKIYLENEMGDSAMYYTLDGSTPTASSTRYTGSFTLTQTATVKAVVLRNGQPAGRVTEQPYIVHKAYGRKPQIKNPYSTKSFPTTDMTLTDGVLGHPDDRSGGAWQPYLGADFEATIDLGSVQPISTITTHFLEVPQSGIFEPQNVVFTVSEDGKNFRSVASFNGKLPQPDEAAEVETYSQALTNQKGRYVKVTAKNIGTIPIGFTNTGKPAKLLIDEIVVE